jgi:hypothetical protein
MVQYQSEYLKIELVNNSSTILLTWKGFIPSEIYRESLNKSLEIAKKYKIKKWISDIKQIKVVGVKDQEWAGTDWLSRAVTSGCYQKQGVIMADDIFGQASAKKILTNIQNQEIEIQNFNKLEEAIIWLKN